MEPIKQMTKEEKLKKAKELYKTANADQRYVLERLFPELIERKPAWSEEDSNMLEEIVKSLKRYQLQMPSYRVELQMRWLKSLKERYTYEPSDEQMKILNEVLNFAANHESPHWNDYIFGTLNNLIRQLKKLREE